MNTEPKPVINICQDTKGRNVSIEFHCPGCQFNHHLCYQDTPADVVGPRWHWNGDLIKPVLRPSIAATFDWVVPNKICHSFVGHSGAAPGEIIFLSDSTHKLAGTVAAIPEWKEEYDD